MREITISLQMNSNQFFKYLSIVQRIEREAYPEEYQTLQDIESVEDILEYLEDEAESGILILNDSEEWYLIINIEDKEIVDWASTKSLSLKDLYQVLKVFREYEIYEFSADFRESTSYKLIKIAEKCGVVSILRDNVWKWEEENFHKCLIRINRFFRR